MEELVTLFTHLLNKIVDDFGKGNVYFSVFEPHFLIMKISTIVLLPFELAF